jgi:hypothetical protein
MIDVRDQCEAGAFSPRFQAVDPGADRQRWEGRLRLKGIDATVYAYTLFRALESVVPRIGRESESERWSALAERARRAVRGRMWDAAEGMFFDVDARTLERTGVMAAVCFLPYGTDLTTAEHLAGLERHLFDPRRFWTEYPVPSVSADDPLFSATATWKGRRHGAPWNGRLWPVVNCQLVDALARCALAVAPHLRERAAQLLRRFVHMMFDEGDPARPNAYEHYDPISGRGSVYRGLDDTQTAWVVDLIVQYVMGIRPHDGGITIDPFPFGLEQAELRGVYARGRTLDVSIVGDRVSVVTQGARRETALGTSIEIPD